MIYHKKKLTCNYMDKWHNNNIIKIKYYKYKIFKFSNQKLNN